jgi:hypothetical protein
LLTLVVEQRHQLLVSHVQFLISLVVLVLGLLVQIGLALRPRGMAEHAKAQNQDDAKIWFHRWRIYFSTAF